MTFFRSLASHVHNVFLFAGVSLAIALTLTPAQAQLVTDPIRDTFGSGTPVDITQINYTLTASSITFTAQFLSSITPPSSISSTDLFGFIDIDTDRNPLTGLPTILNSFGTGPSANLGVDYYIDLGSEESHTGRVDIVSGLTFNIVGTAPITYTLNGFSTTASFSSLGLSTGTPGVNYGLLAATPDEPTDKAFYVAQSTTAAPEPGSLALLLPISGAVGMVIRKQQRRRHRRCSGSR